MIEWLTAACFAASSSALPPELQGVPASRFIVAYAQTAGSSPHAVMALDSNLEILFACEAGATADALVARGILKADSQLALLEEWQLIRHADGQVRTAIPILGPEEAEVVRGAAKGIAAAVAERAAAAIGRFAELVRASGEGDASFPVLFSYVLDTLVWDALEARGALEKRSLGIENPHWSGTIWIIYPPRDDMFGTNTVSEEDVALKMNWSEKLMTVAPEIFDFQRLLAVYGWACEGNAPDEAMRNDLARLGLHGDREFLGLVRIRADGEDPVHTAAVLLAEEIADAVLAAHDDEAVKAAIEPGDSSDRLVILYHEVMWDILRELERQGVVERPAILDGRGDKEDVASLMFIVVAPAP